MKEYIFTKEVKRWGVEAGDIYNPKYHMYQGGTEKLLQEGIIEEEIAEVDEQFNEQAMKVMKDLGLPEDEAEILLEDYNMGY